MTRMGVGWPKTGKEEGERMGLMKRTRLDFFPLLFLLIWTADRGRGDSGRYPRDVQRLRVSLGLGSWQRPGHSAALRRSNIGWARVPWRIRGSNVLATTVTRRSRMYLVISSCQAH